MCFVCERDVSVCVRSRLSFLLLVSFTANYNLVYAGYVLNAVGRAYFDM